MEKNNSQNKQKIPDYIQYIWIGLGILGLIVIIGALSSNNNMPSATQNTVSTDSGNTRRFYVKSTANVRKCASLSCDIIVTSYKGSYTNGLPYKSYDDLPEWVEVSMDDSVNGGGIVRGFINKINLTDQVTTSDISQSTTNNSNPSQPQTSQTNPSPTTPLPPPPTTPTPNTTSCNGISYSACPAGQDLVCTADGKAAYCQSPSQQAQSQPQNTPNTQPKNLSGIIKEWRKSTTYIACFWTYSNGNAYYSQSGSGLAVVLNSAPTIITNHHVVYSSQYGGANECDVRFPDDSGFYVYSSNTPMTGGQGYFPDKGNISYLTNLDVAYITGIENTWISLPFGSQNYPTVSFLNRTRSDSYLCKTPLDIGNPIVILGYPIYGTQIRQGALSPVEITATEGIISGQDSGYYTTSAKIDHGNSGGLAIDKDNNCYFGIPTWDLSGSFESLGRILPAATFLHY